MPAGNVGATDARLFPGEARAGQRDYTGQLVVRFSISVNGAPCCSVDRSLGEVPVMVRVSVIGRWCLVGRNGSACGGDPDVGYIYTC